MQAVAVITITVMVMVRRVAEASVDTSSMVAAIVPVIIMEGKMVQRTDIHRSRAIHTHSNLATITISSLVTTMASLVAVTVRGITMAATAQ